MKLTQEVNFVVEVYAREVVERTHGNSVGDVGPARVPLDQNFCCVVSCSIGSQAPGNNVNLKRCMKLFFLAPQLNSYRLLLVIDIFSAGMRPAAGGEVGEVRVIHDTTAVVTSDRKL